MASPALKAFSTLAAGLVAALGVSLAVMRCSSRPQRRASTPDGSLSRPEARLTSDAVAHCTNLSALVPSKTDDGWVPPPPDKNAPSYTGVFALPAHPTRATLLTLIYAGTSRFEVSLVDRLAQNMGDPSNETAELLRALEEQRRQSETRTPLRDGRVVMARMQGLGLGGKVRWATLDGAHGYALTAVVVLEASDSELANAERESVGKLASDEGLAKLLECVEGLLWP